MGCNIYNSILFGSKLMHWIPIVTSKYRKFERILNKHTKKYSELF